MTQILIEKVYEIFKRSSGVSTDTRTIKKDTLFFCLKGEKFNANEFASEAINKGAIAVIIDEAQYAVNENIILVENVLVFLQKLANFHRQKFNIPFIGITGTNGKTTTKELVSAALSAGLRTHATAGNFNNHIGVPLTLLSMPLNTEIAVIEMGANHQGEIEELCKIAQPDYGLITNIGKAHLEGFGGFEGVVKTKNELYNYIRKFGKTIFINGDDELLMSLSAGLKRIQYGQNSNCEIQARLLESNPFLKIEIEKEAITTHLLGDYNFSNALAAYTIASFFGVNKEAIRSAISQYMPSNKRSQFVETEINKLYLDAYNANPTSMKNALDSFLKTSNWAKMVILGDMLELGKESATEHQQIVDSLSKETNLHVLLVGPEFHKTNKNADFLSFITTEEAGKYLSENKVENQYILIKGSRGIGLERLLGYL